MLVYQRVLTAGLLWSEKNQLSEGFISNFNSTTSRRSVHFFSLIRRSYHCHILSSCLAQPSQYPPNNHSMPFIINMWTVWVGAWVSPIGAHRCPSVPIGTHRSAGLESLLLSRGACSEPVPLHAVFKKIVVEATFIQSIRGCSWFWSIWFCSMTWVHSATHYDTAVFTVSDFLGTPSFDTLVVDNVPAITSW